MQIDEEIRILTKKIDQTTLAQKFAKFSFLGLYLIVNIYMLSVASMKLYIIIHHGPKANIE